MPWYFPWSDALKKRACRYLLQRYLGQFLQEKLSLDQLSVDLYSGRGTITEVSLDVQALNEIGETYNLPFEIVYGFIGSISVSIPWSSLLSESSVVEVHKLTITVQPKQRSQNASMFDSTWGSMMSSLQLAQECLRERSSEEERDAENSQPFEGVELFAQTIDTVFRRIKVTFVDSVFRVEHVPKLSKSGVAMEMRVRRIDYFDEAGAEESSGSQETPHNIYEPVAFSTKKFCLEGTTFYTNEFPIKSFFRSSYHSSNGPKSPNLSPDQHSAPVDEDDTEGISDPILISRLIGKQEVRLKLKLNEDIEGPKVDVEFNIGPVPIFLTPHQLHLLLELFKGLSQPETEDNRNQWNVKPMGAADFAVVEQELQKRLALPLLPGHSLHHRQGWSSHSLNDSEDEFHPLTSGVMSASHMFDNDLSLDSSISSRTTADSATLSERIAKTTRTGRGRVQELLEDSITGLTEFRINCSTVMLLITHDDVTTTPSTGRSCESLSKSNTLPHLKAEHYFEELVGLVLGGHSLRDFVNIREKITGICGASHLRLMGAPVVIEGSKKMLGIKGITTTSLTVANMELFECLVEKLSDSVVSSTYTELLKFSGEVPNREGIILNSSKDPCLRLRIKQQENAMQCHSSKEVSTSFKFELTSVFGELDISIIDRLNTLFSPRPLYTRNEIHNDHVGMQLLEDDHNTLSFVEKCEIHISSPLVIVNLRFPIPDMRPVLNMDRSPWWKKNVRREICIIEMTEVTLQTSWSTSSSDIKYEIQCKDSHGLFQEAETSVPIPFLRISVDPMADGKATDSGFDWPRLVLTVSPVQMPSLLEADASAEGEDPMYISSLDTLLCQVKATELSPFSSHEVLYGSESCDKQQDHNRDSTNQVITPGDKDQIVKFMNKTINNSQYSFQLTLPTLHIYLPDKRFYELLYNRITTDLLLWEPAAPQPVYSADSFRMDPSSRYIKASTYFDTFSMCKSAIQYDSSSDSEDSSTVFYSANDQRYRRQQRHSKGSQHALSNRQSYISISVSVNEGQMTFCSPLQEDTENSYLGYCGEFQLQVENGTFFCVSSYQGDPQVSYTCLCLNRGSMFHNGLTPMKSLCRRLEPASLKKPSHLHATLYRSQSGILTPQAGGDSSDLFSLVIRVGLDSNCSMRTIKVAVGLKEATLRHRITPSENWLNQLIDFFNISNFPVTGYEPPPIITELHLHLQNCAIDYRPLYLPLRALATVDNFNISSNVVAQSTTSLLRIISEELCFYISDKTNTEVLDLRKNYVCVVDTGLIDLLLRRTDGKDQKQPKVDLRASNNNVHIHTCTDSFMALQDLIAYVASDGDLQKEMQSPKSTEMFSLNDHVPVDESHFMDAQEHVNDLMAEAMHESMYSSFPSPYGPESLVASSNADSSKEELENSTPDVESSGHETRDGVIDNLDDDCYDDEEFCILEDDPGTGIIPPSGEPTVRSLTSDPIQMVENHFMKPVGKTDKLKTPKHFPSPTKRYTLQEMSLTWHLYGGHDFRLSEEKEKKLSSNLDDIDTWSNESCPHSPTRGVTINPNTQSITFSKIPKSSSTNSTSDERWRSGQCWGGTGRSQDVIVELQMTKVRFQHEIFPEKAEQAARQVLLVHDIVIRDRLATSEINKFLYQYTCEALPRQTHAHMLVVKALHIRPDPSHSTSECSLKVSLQPLRLNIDQDTLLFLITFLTKQIESDRVGAKDPDVSKNGPESAPSCELHSWEKSNGPLKNQKAKMSLPLDRVVVDEKEMTGKKLAPPVFFRSVIFSPEVPIRLDYHGKRVDMEQGALAGVLMGLAHLNCSEIRLKRLSYRHGLLGMERLIGYSVNEWLADIKKNQLPSLLGGVGPMYAFVQLFQGIRDLVWLPIEQYRKDGRILLGLQRGANSFTTSTTMSFLELTNRMVQLIQGAAEFTYDMVSPGPSAKSHSWTVQKKWHLNTQPADLREGVNNAFHVVREGLYDTAQNIFDVASEEHRCKGVPGAVGAILRQIPPAAVKPIILATEATSNVLGGARHQIVPDTRREAVEKWRHKRSHRS